MPRGADKTKRKKRNYDAEGQARAAKNQEVNQAKKRNFLGLYQASKHLKVLFY
jgi:hypothetical protein